jgi:hypothetical protein
MFSMDFMRLGIDRASDSGGGVGDSHGSRIGGCNRIDYYLSTKNHRRASTMSSGNNFYRYFLNPVMRSLLRSPLHGITSNNIGIVHYTGRKSGRKLNTPLSYTREGGMCQ